MVRLGKPVSSKKSLVLSFSSAFSLKQAKIRTFESDSFFKCFGALSVEFDVGHSTLKDFYHVSQKKTESGIGWDPLGIPPLNID